MAIGCRNQSNAKLFSSLNNILIQLMLFMFFLIGMWLIETQGALGILQLAISLIILGIPIYFLIEMYYSSEAIRRVKCYDAVPDELKEEKMLKIDAPKKFKYIELKELVEKL